MLNPEQIKRYSRQTILPEIGKAGQEKLGNASVLVIGAGGLGCPVLQYLAASGVGKIGIVDFDTIDISNLQRQVLYTEKELGLQKSEVAKNKIQALNSLVEVESFNLKVSADNILSLIENYDIIVDGTDNFESKYLINDACVIKNKTLVFGSIHSFQGQVSVFNYKNGPTYRCVFPEPSETDNCNVNGVIGVLPGIIGTLMANEVLKIILEIGEVLSGTLLVVDALSLNTTTYHFEAVEANKNIIELIES